MHGIFQNSCHIYTGVIHLSIGLCYRMVLTSVACLPLARSAEHRHAGRAGCHDLRILVLPLLLRGAEGLCLIPRLTVCLLLVGLQIKEAR